MEEAEIGTASKLEALLDLLFNRFWALLESNQTNNWELRSLYSVSHPCMQTQHHKGAGMALNPVRNGRGAWLLHANGKRYLLGTRSW